MRLRFESDQGFWLAFLFSASPETARSIRQWLMGYLTERRQELCVLIADSHPELATLKSRFPSRRKMRSCKAVWIEALHRDFYQGRKAPWAQSWTELLTSIAQKRPEIENALSGGLIFVASPQMKQLLSEAAQGLWDQSIVIDLIPPWLRSIEAAAEGVSGTDDPLTQITSDRAEVEEPSDSESRRRRRKEHPRSSRPEPPAKLLKSLDRVRRLLFENRHTEASLLARLLIQRHQSEEGAAALIARARYWLARAERAAGRTEAAQEVISQALERSGELPPSQLLRFLDLAGQTALEQENRRWALKLYRQALTVAKTGAARPNATRAARRDFSLVLNRLARALKSEGRLRSALVCSFRALAIRRELLAEDTSRQALRDVSYSSAFLAELRLSLDEPQEALKLIDDSLAIDRQLSDETEQDDSSLRDLTAGLTLKVRILRRLNGGAEIDRVEAELHRLRARS